MLQNNKSLGQHWLRDRFILDLIADLASENTARKHCLEIGPGLGTLTSSLLRNFDHVTSVEFDEKLAKNLPKSFPGKNLTVIHADFLKFPLSSVGVPYSVAANIPYYITSPIIERLLEAENRPQRIVLLIQKEVAERIAAKKGKNSILSLFVQNLAEVELSEVVGREYFTPPPRVDSQIIVLTPRETPLVPKNVIDFASRAFVNPRKKLTANLSTSGLCSRQRALECVRELNISENARPEDLSLHEWKALADLIKKS